MARGAVPQSRPFPNAAQTLADFAALNHLQGMKETWRQRVPSAGAVPASLHTVQDLLLQFLPLLLLLGQSLGCWL